MKVLVAEDDTASRIVLEKHLRDWGYEVISAPSGQEAWEKIRDQQPQIVLADWVMPGMDGLELCRKVRSQPNRKYTYIIFLTSKRESEDMITALDAGADDYLCKPLERDILKSRMAVGARTINYENNLALSEERYHRITNSITDCIFTVKISTGKITEILHSDSSIAVTGYGPQELDQNPSLWLEMVYKDDQKRATEQVDKCLTGEKVEPMEYRIIHKDGQLRWIKSTIVQHFDKSGELTSYDRLIQDITERKNAEEQMRIAKEKAEEAQVKLEKLNLQLEKTYKKLMETAHRAGMAEVAANVLHNVGNALNSINVSAAIVAETIQNTETGNLVKVADLIAQHENDIADFLTNDPKGRHVPTYICEVSKHLAAQQAETLEKLQAIIKNVDHVKDIVKMQQLYTTSDSHMDRVVLSELIENAIEINNSGLQRESIEVIREYEEMEKIIVDKQKTLQILVNMIDNAEHALSRSSNKPKILRIRTFKLSDEKVKIEVIDNGIGIEPQNLEKIFEQGFTTKQTGHGFGLHSCLLAVNEMEGSLTAHSEGTNKGTTFIFELPIKNAEVKSGKDKQS
ncbi:MAG: response regulator [Sedimentisphaerales bacterium]|nr:response regulator [Sedimentisphaerales bacterium]